MSGIIKTIKAKDEHDVQHNIFPKTVLEAVVDSETNETLDNIIDELNNKIDNIEITGGTPVENLLVYPYAISNETTDNYTIIDNGDGTLTISCNFPELSMANVQIVSDQPISAGTYTVSGCSENFTDSTVNINVYVDDTSGNRIHYGNVSYGQNFTFTVTELCYLSISLWFNSGASLTDAVLKPMLELGTVAHDYKPYKDVSKANQTDIDNKVSKSGDTMTGALNVRDGVYIASERDNTGEIINPVPIAGVLQDEITDFTNLSKFKSFIGSAYYGTGWYSIISSRHRNGVGDGAYYGMMLSSPMTTENATLRWNRQYGDGKWQGERVILDSINYNQYALPLSGGTVTGLTKFNGDIQSSGNDYYYNGIINSRLNAGGGSSGYWKFLTITYKTGATYSGSMISFKVSHRGTARGIVNIYINNGATANTGFAASISQTGNCSQCYIIQSATGVFDVYLAKTQSWDEATITDLCFPTYQRDRFTLTWTNSFAASLPSGYTAATVTNEWSNIVTAPDESGSVSFTMKAGCSYLISVRHITQGTMHATGIIVPTRSSWSYYSIGVGGSAFHSISGSTFTYSFGGTNTLAKGKVQLKYIEIG